MQAGLILKTTALSLALISLAIFIESSAAREIR